MRTHRLLKLSPLLLAVGIGATIGVLVWNHVAAPYENPTETYGPLAKAQVSQRTNVLRYVVFLISILSSMSVALLSKSYRNLISTFSLSNAELDHSTTSKANHALIAVLAVAIFSMASHYSLLDSGIANARPQMDHYHHGLVTAAIVADEHGKEPYVDYYPTRGILVDVTKASPAFALFGKSQSSLITMDSILQAISFGILGVLFLLLFSGNTLAALLCSAVYVCNSFSSYIIPTRFAERDVAYTVFLILLLLLTRVTSLRTRSLLVFMLSFLPPFAYAIALDRGLISSILYLIAFPLFLFSLVRENRPRLILALSALAGLAFGVLVLGWLVEWNLSAFASYVFGDLLAYRGYVEGLEFLLNTSHLRSAAYRAYALLIQGAVVGWLIFKIQQALLAKQGNTADRLTDFVRASFFEIMFALLALAAFLYALNFSDRAHIATGASWSTAFLLYKVIRYLANQQSQVPMLRKAMIGAIIGGNLWGGAVYARGLLAGGALTLAYPIGVSDHELLDAEHRVTVDYLKSVVSDTALFASLTNEGSWYYLIDQPCPLPFAEIWLASSKKFQGKSISAFNNKPIKYVLYDNDAVWRNIGSMSVRERVPLIFEYVEQNFEPHKRIGSQQIWIRKVPENDTNRLRRF